jgi:hypothetical protein
MSKTYGHPSSAKERANVRPAPPLIPLAVRHPAALKAMHKQNEIESREMRNNHRDARRQMEARHEKNIQDLHASQAAERAAGVPQMSEFPVPARPAAPPAGAPQRRSA